MGGQAIADAKRDQHWFIDAQRAVVVGWDTKDGPEHPHWDERAEWPVDEELADDIIERGQMQAVTVRKDGRGPEAPLIVIYGRQRVKAVRRANEKLAAVNKPPILLKAELIKNIDDQGVVLAGLAENSHRSDSDPITNAKALHRAVHVHKTPIKEACQAMRVKVQTGQAWLRYFDLDSKVQKAVSDDKISFTAAVELADLKREDQRERLKELVAEGRPTVAAARRAKAQTRRANGESTKARSVEFPVPTRRTLRKIADHGDKYGVDGTTMAVISAVIGDRDLAGLSPAVANVLKAIEDKEV